MFRIMQSAQQETRPDTRPTVGHRRVMRCWVMRSRARMQRGCQLISSVYFYLYAVFNPRLLVCS
ncbi:hypothetical protein Hdeb2414_s0003g00093421 [Helianthus debilis subsp. tardiflorus]